MERKKYFINGESGARKCGMFDAFYASGESEYAGVNVLAIMVPRKWTTSSKLIVNMVR